MKSSDIELAQKLVRDREFYERMRGWLNAYPGYDATMIINSHSLMIGRDQALAILDQYVEDGESLMRDIGLDYQEEQP